MKFLNESSMSKILISKLTEGCNSYTSESDESIVDDNNPELSSQADAWYNNFVITAIQSDGVYWKRKSDGKEIKTSFDVFTKPMDPTEWKSEDELTNYILEEDLGPAEKIYNKRVLNNKRQVNNNKNNAVELNEEENLPNISKFIYDLDADKGNAWSVSSYTKNASGKKVIVVNKNGKSDNSEEDIIKAVEEKYPKLKGYEYDNSVLFYLRSQI